MGILTFILYLGVLAIWALMLLRFMRGPKPAPTAAKTNLIILTLVVAVLTVLQVMGMRA